MVVLWFLRLVFVAIYNSDALDAYGDYYQDSRASVFNVFGMGNAIQRRVSSIIPGMLGRQGRRGDVIPLGLQTRRSEPNNLFRASRMTGTIIDISGGALVNGGKEQKRNQALLTKQEILLENINKFLTAPKKSVVNSHSALLDLLETLKHVIQDKTDFETLQKPQFFDDTLSETSTGDYAQQNNSSGTNLNEFPGSAAGIDNSEDEFHVGGIKHSDSERYDRRIQKWMQETIAVFFFQIKNQICFGRVEQCLKTSIVPRAMFHAISLSKF